LQRGTSSLPGVNFCAPATMWLSTITPKMLRAAAQLRRDVARHVRWRSCCLLLLAWLQSTIRPTAAWPVS
jgi:hypothetical protein